MKIVTTCLAAMTLIALPAALIAHEPAEQNKKPAKSEVTTSQPKAEPQSHSGGTDSRGCHTNHKTGKYHCHKPK